MICPECGHEDLDGRDWEVKFCPSYPDKCRGCEIAYNWRKCPECEHEWEIDAE